MRQKVNYKALSYTLVFAILIPLATWIYYPILTKKKSHVSYERIFTRLHLHGSYEAAYDTPQYTAMLQKFIDSPEVRTIVALGCTAWNTNNLVIPEDKTFIGYDVVADIVAANNAEFSKHSVHFYYVENLHDFIYSTQKGDLLIVKDFLQYWPNKDIKYLIKKIFPKFKYSIITSNIIKDSNLINQETKLGEKRTIDLSSKPFSLQHAKLLLEYSVPQTQEHKQVLLYKRNHV